MKKAVKKLAGIVFIATFITLFLLVGSIEQDYISIENGLVWIAVNYIVMWIAGRKAEAIQI